MAAEAHKKLDPIADDDDEEFADATKAYRSDAEHAAEVEKLKKDHTQKYWTTKSGTGSFSPEYTIIVKENTKQSHHVFETLMERGSRQDHC